MAEWAGEIAAAKAAEVIDNPWMLRAACLGVPPHIFFPAKGESTAAAKAACGGCPVRSDCLDYALRQRIEHGVWGGLSEPERDALRRERGAA